MASNPSVSERVDRVIAISLPTYNELAWKPTDALIYVTHGTPHEKIFDSHQYLKAMARTAIVILNATDDDTAPLPEAKSLFAVITVPKRFYAIAAKGHHFEDGETEFYRDLDIGLTLGGNVESARN